MLAFTGSGEGVVLYSRIGNFLSETEPHAVIVKSHSLELYSLPQIQQEPADEPEFNIPLQATVQAAHAFKLPGSAFHNIAILTLDVSLVLFMHTSAEEDEFPFEKIVLDQVRSQFVVPDRWFLSIASVQNYLICQIYPDTLTVVTFKESGIEKNELHFSNFTASSLISDRGSLLGVFPECCRILDGGKIAGLLEEAQADASNGFREIRFGRIFSRGCSLSGDRVIAATKEGLKAFDESGEKEVWPYPTAPELFGYDPPYLVFKNGMVFKFVDGKFEEVGSIPGIVKVTGETEELVMGMGAKGPVVFVKETKKVLTPFGRKEIKNGIVVPHSVRGAGKLIINCYDWIESYGLGYPFAVESVMDLEGEAVFAAGGYVVVTTAESSVVLSQDSLAPVQVDGIRSNEPTLCFCQFGTQLVQVCPTGINAIGKDPIKFEKLHHAAANSRYLAVAEQQKVILYEFQEGVFKELRTVSTEDEVSSILVSDSGYLVCATWRNTALMTVNIETGAEFILDVKVVVKSLCELDGVLFYGSSRGDLAVATIDADGKITEAVRAKVGRMAVSLSVVEACGQKAVFAAGSHPSIVVFKEGALDVYPATVPKPCVGHLQLAPSRSIVLGSELSVGKFEDTRIVEVDRSEAGDPITFLAKIDDTRCAAFTEQKRLVLFDTNLIEQVMSAQLEMPGYFVMAEFFTIGSNTYFAGCFSDLESDSVETFSEAGFFVIWSVNPATKSVTQVVKYSMERVPTVCRFEDGKLYVARGSTVVAITVSEKEDGGIALVQSRSVDTQMFACDMAVDFGRVALFDGFASAIVLTPDLEDSGIRDYLAKRLGTGCFVDDITLVVADLGENVYHLLIEEERIRTIGKYNIGTKLTSLHRWRPRPDAKEVIVGTGVSGEIFLFSPLDRPTYDKLANVEHKLAAALEDQGWLNHARFRSIVGDRYLDPSIGFIDGDLLRDMEELDDSQQSGVIGEAKQVIDSITAMILENTFAKRG